MLLEFDSVRGVQMSSYILGYKYNMSVDNKTHYLYTKIVYFVRATGFDLIGSSSGPPRRHSRVVYVSLHCGIPNSYKFLLEKCKIHKLVYVELV